MEFITSPASWYRLGDFLLDGLNSADRQFWGAVAFARISGVKQIEKLLASFTLKSEAHLVVGVDMQGTSIEALDTLSKCIQGNSRLYIFQDPTCTFHPKIFAFFDEKKWDVYCGSGNLTGGGLYPILSFGCISRIFCRQNLGT